MTSPDDGQARPGPRRIDSGWWVAPVTTAGVVFLITVVDCWLLGFAVMAWDECDPSQPCGPADAVTHVYDFAAVATLVGLPLTFALSWRSAWPFQWAAAAATMLSAAYPALWLLSGYPKL
jgi:hypothetical protein